MMKAILLLILLFYFQSASCFGQEKHSSENLQIISLEAEQENSTNPGLSIASPNAPPPYLLLVQTWVPTFCKKFRCKNINNNYFTMHGLWPADANGNSIDGGGSSTNLNTVFQQLRRDLDRAWPANEESVSNEALWNHEWRAHGVASLLTPLQYFQKAIRETDSLNGADRMALVRKMRDAGVRPSDTVAYSRDRIQEVIRQGLNPRNDLNIYISCRPVSDDPDKFLLFEVHICLRNQVASLYETCPANRNNRGCGSNPSLENIFFPTRSFRAFSRLNNSWSVA